MVFCHGVHGTPRWKQQRMIRAEARAVRLTYRVQLDLLPFCKVWTASDVISITHCQAAHNTPSDAWQAQPDCTKNT